MLCRSGRLSLTTLSSHIDAALDLVLLNYAGDVDTEHCTSTTHFADVFAT